MVSAALFFFHKPFINYHLSATPDEHVKVGGAKVIIEHVVNVGKAEGYKWLHLGGGLGGDEDDSLFIFKKGFSKLRLSFCVARWEA